MTWYTPAISRNLDTVDTMPTYLTDPVVALSRAQELEDALLAAADPALAVFLERVVRDASDGEITRASIMTYWVSSLTKALSHPSFSSIRDDLLAEMEHSEFADDAYSAALMALETAHTMGATSDERLELLSALFQHPTPSLVASLSARVDRWLTRRIQRFLRLRLRDLGPEDLTRDDLAGPLYDIPTSPSERSVRSDEWLEDDRPGELNWRARMQRDIRTAYTRAFGQNMLRLLEKYGFAEKGWVSRKDERVRPTHIHADGQWAPLYGTFEVGVARLRFPGDPTGPASETINCRCVIVGRGPGARV